MTDWNTIMKDMLENRSIIGSRRKIQVGDQMIHLSMHVTEIEKPDIVVDEFNNQLLK